MSAALLHRSPLQIVKPHSVPSTVHCNLVIRHDGQLDGASPLLVPQMP